MLGDTYAKLEKNEIARKLSLEKGNYYKSLQMKSRMELREKGYEYKDDKLNMIAGGKAQRDDDIDKEDYELQKKLIKNLQGRLASTAFFQAMEDFTKDGNANSFQLTLDNDPYSKEAWSKRGIKHISNIDFVNDKDLLESAGITEEFTSKPGFIDKSRKNLFKVYDGEKWAITSVEDMAAEIGYYRKVSDRKSKQILDHISSYRNAIEGKDSDLMKDEVNAKVTNAKSNLLNANTASDAQQLENRTSDRKHQLSLDELELKAKEFAYKEKNNLGNTSKQKDLIASRKYTESLLSNFGGSDEYFNTNFNKRENQLKAYSDVIAIEKLEGINRSDGEEDDLHTIREVIAISNPILKLSPKDTGLFDRLLGNVKKYVYDSVDGIKAKSAYLVLRNSLRHALYGGALTEAEIRSYNEAQGSLGQKLGPVLAQFRINLLQVKSKLDSISRNGNPYITKFRLGIDNKRLESVMKSLDERIDFISGKIKTPDPSEPSDGRESLDSIYNRTTK